MTRVTENMMFRAISRDVNRAQLRQYEAQLRATSGRRVQKASDDPVAANRAAVMQSGLSRLEAMGNAAGRAELMLNGTETALAQTLELIDDVRDIALSGGSDPTSGAERTRMASTVDAMRVLLRDTANTEIDGEYVFGGYLTGSPAFLADGTFAGDGGIRDVEVAPGISAAMNVSGADAFTAAGGEDIMALLQNLRDDLLANDPVAIRSRLSALDTAREQLTRAHVGASMNLRILQEAAEARRALRETFTSAHEDAVAVDTTQAYVDLLHTQTALEATSNVASSILDALRSGLRF